MKFCKVCGWAYQAWVTHKHLYDQNDKQADTLEKAVSFFNRLSTITHEYSLQQVSKLHDPAQQGDDLNVSIEFVVKYGEWGDKEAEVKKIAEKLAVLGKLLKPARNKILSHYDLNALLVNEALGGFPEGEDDIYFAALQELVDEVHDRWVDGGPYPFDALCKNDVSEFLNVLERSK